MLGQKIRAGRKSRQEEKAGEGWTRTQKKQSNESKRKLLQLLVPAPRVSPHHHVLQGCRAAHSLSPAAKQVVLQPSPSATGRHPGWGSACAHHVPWAGITLESPPGTIQAGQSSGAHQSPLVFRAPFQFFLSLMTSTKTRRAGTHCILGHSKTQW